MIKEIFKLFFRLGLVAFGGPAAHIAMFHKEVVEKRQWMDEQHFLDLMGATSVIPGPNSTEMAIHCGYHRGGVLGLLTAGLSFLVPACLLTGVLAFLYQEANQLPNIEVYFMGIKPVAMVLIIQALLKLWKKAIKTWELVIVTGIVVGLCFVGLNQVLALFLGSFIGWGFLKVKDLATSSSPKSISLTAIFLIFLKVGSVLFGSGYVLIAYLQNELVDQLGWISTEVLADAIALGQVTPGPVLATSTFIGYILAGGPGAVLATIGIFLPSFIFVLILNPIVPKLRNSKNFGVLLDCLNAASLGLMAYALYPLGKVTLQSWTNAVVLALALVVAFGFKKVGPIPLVIGGAVLGAVMHFSFVA